MEIKVGGTSASCVKHEYNCVSSNFAIDLTVMNSWMLNDFKGWLTLSLNNLSWKKVTSQKLRVKYSPFRE